MVNNNHHVAGKDMCVWGFCVSVFRAKEKASINRSVMGMKSYVRVSVDHGTCKAFRVYFH
jgi:hypothetical protein